MGIFPPLGPPGTLIELQFINVPSPAPAVDVVFNLAELSPVTANCSAAVTDSMGITRVQVTVPVLNTTLASEVLVNITMGTVSSTTHFEYQSLESFAPQMVGAPRPRGSPVTGGKFVRVQVCCDSVFPCANTHCHAAADERMGPANSRSKRP